MFIMGQFSSDNAKCRIKLLFQCISYSAVTEYCFTLKAPLKILEIDGEQQEEKKNSLGWGYKKWLSLRAISFKPPTIGEEST